MTTPGRTDPKHIVILGAGLAGLSVARELLRADTGCRVTVVEKDNHVGGLATSLEVGGVKTDLGPHRIYSTIPEMRRWFDEFLSDRIYAVRRMSRMYYRGQFLRYPPAAMDMLKVFGPWRMARFAGGYAWARMLALAGLLPPDSFAHVMRRAFGEPVCQALVYPYAQKVWKLPPDRISADVARTRATMGGMRHAVRRMLRRAEPEGKETSLQSFHYITGGIGELANALANDIQAAGGRIILQSEAREIILREGQVQAVCCRSARGESSRLECDFVFSTTPLPELVLSIRGDAPGLEDARHAARSLRYLSSMLVFILARRPSLSADHWLYFPEPAQAINRAYESKNFDPSIAPPDRTLLCVEGTAMEGDAHWSKSDTAIQDRFVQDVVSTGLLRDEEIIHLKIHRLSHAYPLYNLDYRQHLDTIIHGLHGVDNLITLGRQGLFLHNNMDHSIHMGLRAAACWMQGGEAVRNWYAMADALRDIRIVD